MLSLTTIRMIDKIRQNARNTAYYLFNAETCKAASRRYHHANCKTPERKKRAWLRGIKSRFGVSEVEYMAMLESQGGVCAICGKKNTKRLAVDHDHNTGKVRGLLCGKCNTTLGWFETQTDNINSYLD